MLWHCEPEEIAGVPKMLVKVVRYPCWLLCDAYIKWPTPRCMDNHVLTYRLLLWPWDWSIWIEYGKRQKAPPRTHVSDIEGRVQLAVNPMEFRIIRLCVWIQSCSNILPYNRLGSLSASWILVVRCVRLTELYRAMCWSRYATKRLSQSRSISFARAKIPFAISYWAYRLVAHFVS